MNNDETNEAILEAINNDPNASVRELARLLRTNAETQQHLRQAGFETEAGQTSTPSATTIYRILKVDFKISVSNQLHLGSKIPSIQNAASSRIITRCSRKTR